ncbi:MAG: hypothetical protein ACI9OS_001435, partial [Ulvibacter sp.]
TGNIAFIWLYELIEIFNWTPIIVRYNDDVV